MLVDYGVVKAKLVTNAVNLRHKISGRRACECQDIRWATSP